MKWFSKDFALPAVIVFCVLGLILLFVFKGPASTLSIKGSGLAAVAVPLLGADDFSVLSSTYTNTVVGTTINGDLGYTTGPAAAPVVSGTTHVANATYAQAGIDQVSALGALNIQACDFNFPGATDLSLLPQPLLPGVYCINGATSIGAGGITLDTNGVFIFRTVGALTTLANSVVLLSGGASACDVYWTPSAATTLGANSTFVGTNIDNAGITVGSTVSWVGRALAFGGTVTTDVDTITVPACVLPTTITVVKTVINDNAATSTVADFPLFVNGVPVVSSTTNAFAAPAVYTVTETTSPNYTQQFSGDCDAGGVINLAPGDSAVCTVTNNDIPQPATISVVKTVINDNGRTKTVGDFPLFVNAVPVVSGATNVFAAPAAYTITETSDANYTQTFSGDCDASGVVNLTPGDIKVCIVTNNDIPQPVTTSSGSSSSYAPPVPPLIDVVKVPNPLALPGGPGLVEYTYTLRNTGIVPASDVTMVGDTCSPILLISGDTNNDAKLDVNETWVHTCSTTLTKTHTNTVVATAWANGLSATDIAHATVVVGAPVVPPLIHVTKVPNPLTLPANGGKVTYMYTVSNPGTAPLSNVGIVDDKCTGLPGRVLGHPGDVNKNNLLESNEVWSFTCETNILKTTTNTVIASGEANGLTVRDFALATVVVSAPTLPDTGFPANKNVILWSVAVLAGILAVGGTAVFFFRKN